MDEKLMEYYKKIQKNATLYMTELLSNPMLQNWRDSSLMIWRSDVKFRKSARDLIAAQMILCRFFNFYFDGVVKAEDRISTILADVIANASTREHDIWPTDVFADKSSFKSNLSCSRDLLTGNVGLNNRASIILTNTDQDKKELLMQQLFKELMIDYTIDEGQKFKELIVAEIKSINPNRSETEEVKRLKRLASFLALTLWRAVAKSKYQLNNAFFEKQYRLDLHVVAGWSKKLPFYPPCNQCIEACIETLPHSTATTNIYILLASEYIYCMKNYNYTSKTKFLYTSVLMDTAKCGLGILKLLENASFVTGLKWNKLLEMTYLNLTADSWETIRKFFDSYLHKDNLQYGYNWARIINEGYLRGYTPEDHLALAGILLGIIEQAQNIEVQNMEWIKEHKEKINEMRLYGKVVYDSVKPNLANLSSPCTVLAHPMDTVKKAQRILANQNCRQEQKRKLKEDEEEEEKKK